MMPFLRVIKQMITETRLAYASIVMALVLGIMTYAVLSSPRFLDGKSDVTLILLGLDVTVLLILSIFVFRRIINLFRERKRRLAGYQLHWRLAILFSIISVLPSLIVMGFAIFVLDYSLRGWFNERISTAVEESVTIANSYLEEHKRSVSGQLLAMANDINREAPNLIGNRKRFDLFLTNQAGVRNMTEALVVDSTGRVLANSKYAYAITFSNLDDDFYNKAKQGEVAIADTENDNRIRAGLRLNQFVDAYLLVGRFVDPTVLAAVDRTQFAASTYQVLDIRQLDLQVSFAVMFGMVSLLLLLGSVWLGLNFANAIVTPISSIISVADKVRSGDHAIRVGKLKDSGEIGELAASFDKMLDEMNKNRQELVEANIQLDKRREFTEAVLAGVSSGVIGIDDNQIITLPNLAAQVMLNLTPGQVIGKKLVDVVPEFADVLNRAANLRQRAPEVNIDINRDNIQLTLLARVTRETVAGRLVGYVVTFDNVSDLMDAQRKAAWADIARRIAHEIRNPLTPIQLAAERLSSKFTISDAKEHASFASNVEMIIRQVDDIRRLVDEFSAFARMPAPNIAPHDLMEIVDSQIMLFQGSDSSITFEKDFQSLQSIQIACDDGMIRQAITNLFQNAVDAMTEANTKDKKLMVSVIQTENEVEVRVIDNGPGLPKQGRKELTNPYVTNRSKGTGLGLAIVNKIMEDHFGKLHLASIGDPDMQGPEGYNGAIVILRFAHLVEEATG
jgi:two-component system nitrogen regulation sensor histidine kinase NtrY